MQSSARSTPGVSVVIPAYNYAHYLPRAINSVLQQDYPLFEVVVVDDGSTDNTRDLVAGYGDKVRYVYQENGGLSAARNTGITHAKHDFLGFIDADDEWKPTLISRIMEAYRKLPGEFAIVACHYDYMDPDGKLLPLKNIVPDHDQEFMCKDLILKTRFTCSSAIIKRQAFQTCGLYDTTLRSSEDRDIWIRVSSKFRVYMIGEKLSLIRRHPNNMSKHPERMKENIQRVLEKTRRAGIASGERLFWCKVFSFFFYQNSWRYHDAGRKWDALADLMKSFVFWPWFRCPRCLNEPPLFRSRSLSRFLREMVFSRRKRS